MAQLENGALINLRVAGSNPAGQLLIYVHNVFPVLTETLCRHVSLVPRSRIKAFVRKPRRCSPPPLNDVIIGESGTSCNSFHSNPRSVKSVECLKLLFISLGTVFDWLHLKETFSNRPRLLKASSHDAISCIKLLSNSLIGKLSIWFPHNSPRESNDTNCIVCTRL